MFETKERERRAGRGARDKRGKRKKRKHEKGGEASPGEERGGTEQKGSSTSCRKTNDRIFRRRVFVAYSDNSEHNKDQARKREALQYHMHRKICS